MYKEKFLSSEETIMPLDIVRNYLRIDNTADDNVIKISISFSEMYVQTKTGITISQKNYEVETDEISYIGEIRLKQKPLQKINSIFLNEKLLSENEYSHNSESIFLHMTNRGIAKINLQFGYCNYKDIPEKIFTGMMIHISHHYENRAGNIYAIPPMLNDLYSEFIKTRL